MKVIDMRGREDTEIRIMFGDYCGEFIHYSKGGAAFVIKESDWTNSITFKTTDIDYFIESLTELKKHTGGAHE